VLPSVTNPRAKTGTSKPDLLALTDDQIITFEITMRSSWKVDDQTTGEAGARMGKRAQAPSNMVNLQPILSANPKLKVLVVFLSDAPPDKTARQEMEDLARGQFGSQISRISWLIA